MRYLAVIDTNILVSYILSKNKESSVVKIIELVKEGIIVPLLQTDIIEEYNTVLRRCKFNISEQTVCDIVGLITDMGIMCDRKESKESFPDPDDIIFYEVSLSVDGSYLITGNLKHFPTTGHVVTPAEMLQIIHLAENSGGSVCEPDIDYMSDQKRAIIERGWEAAEKIRQQAAENGTCNMTLEEINEVIRQCREERRRKT